MRSKKIFSRGLFMMMICVVISVVMACGTILYPERRGQVSGRIDAGVAVLDGIGLIFFLVPGVVAFGVDFATGAIYLPSGSADLGPPPSIPQDVTIVEVQPEFLNHRHIEMLLKKETGQRIDLKSPEMKVAHISFHGDMAWNSIAEVLTPDQLAAFMSD